MKGCNYSEIVKLWTGIRLRLKLKIAFDYSAVGTGCAWNARMLSEWDDCNVISKFITPKFG